MSGIDKTNSEIDDLNEQVAGSYRKTVAEKRPPILIIRNQRCSICEFISREISDVHPVHSYVIANDETIATEKLLKGQATVDKLLTVQLVARQHRANGVGELIF